MKLIPSDTRDFAYTVNFFTVDKGGTLRVRLADGTVVTRVVQDGQFVNLPVRRIFNTGTSARGFNNDLLPDGDYATKNVQVPYALQEDAGIVTENGDQLVTENGEFILY